MERRCMVSVGWIRFGIRRQNPAALLTVGIAATFFLGLAWPGLRSTHATPVLATDMRPRIHKVALDGYCPVALCKQRAWQKGNDSYRAEHEGCIYQLRGAKELAEFQADPSRYGVVICGCDVVLAKDRNQLIDGEREHGLWYQGKIYLFASEDSLRQFQRDPQAYADFSARNKTRLVARFIDRGSDPDGEIADSEPEAAAVAAGP